MPAPTLPDLAGVRSALAQLATQDALVHLESALRSLEGLRDTLQSGSRLAPGEQRELERALLRFRSELRDAGTLADQGLAHCREWADLLLPQPDYQPNGTCSGAPSERHGLSLEA